MISKELYGKSINASNFFNNFTSFLNEFDNSLNTNLLEKLNKWLDSDDFELYDDFNKTINSEKLFNGVFNANSTLAFSDNLDLKGNFRKLDNEIKEKLKDMFKNTIINDCE